jgi:uncharacterized membrane protein
MKTTIITAAVLVGAFTTLPVAQAGTLVPVTPIPGSIAMTVEAINDNNVIAGFYETADGNEHGFVGPLNGTYETFDFGTSNTTIVHGLNNDGYLTGTSASESGFIIGEEFSRRPNGALSPVTKDGTPLDGFANGITDHAKFVGDDWVIDINGHLTVYGYYGKKNTYQADLVLPFNTDRTRPRGLNRHGEVAGYVHDLDRPEEFYFGFVLKDGVATEVAYPDPTTYVTLFYGLNDKGAIVGGWQDENQNTQQAFLYDFDRNAFKPIDVPGATFVSATGINNAGLIAVTDDSTASAKAYIYCSKRKQECPTGGLPTIDVPDRWTPGNAGTRHSRVCADGCSRPGSARPAGGRTDPALIRAAIERDPTLALEFGQRR